ncbi:ribonuclease H-like domain-containing protein, partial [Tanacetum coccineum]
VMPHELHFIIVAAIPYCLSIDTVLRLLTYLFMWMTSFSQLPVQLYFSLFLSQKKYVLQLLEHAHMVTCNLSRTPVDTKSKLGLEGDPVQDPTLYYGLAGGLL